VHAETQPVISVPAGFKLVSITFAASSGSTGVAQLSAATVPDGNNIFQARAIDVRNAAYNPEGITTIEINQAFSMTQSTRIYLTTGTADDTWNEIVFDLYIVLKSLK
jgi:hypothetical protein